MILRHKITLLLLVFGFWISSETVAEKSPVKEKTTYDVGVLMATPGGIAAAVHAARMGMQVILIERSRHLGGLPANGLGATDIHTRQLSGGFFKEFTDSILSFYIGRYGRESQQVKDCSSGFHFEPSVAEAVLENLISKEKNILVLRNYSFESLPENIRRKDSLSPYEIRIAPKERPGKTMWVGAKVWIDGSYEGDLAAAMGCRFRTRRESKEEFGEPMAGRIYKLWGRDSLESGSTGAGDSAIQAFNYRLCLTRNPQNRVLFEKPEGYLRDEFVSLAEDVRAGLVSGFFPKNGTTAGVVNPVKLPNGKFDANNHHRALISTDLPEENHPYPRANWAWRDRFAKRLRQYTEGLLYFAQNDTSLPSWFRTDALEVGWAKDEYRDNGHFPRQVYVREGRRIEGRHIFTAHDALPERGSKRPPVHRRSVVSSHYAIDSHAMRKREKGKNTLDGFISYQTRPFSVPFEVMVPIGKEGLLCPVPVSASHVGYGCLRMEPCWMGLGQAAGVCAALAIRLNTLPSRVPIDSLQKELIDQNANLIFVEDIVQGNPDYKWVQKAALRGWIPDYKARLDEQVLNTDLELWAAKTGIPKTQLESSVGGKTRKEGLLWLIQAYKEPPSLVR